MKHSWVRFFTIALAVYFFSAISQANNSSSSSCEFLVGDASDKYTKLINQIIDDPNYNPMKPFSEDHNRYILEAGLSFRELLFGSRLNYQQGMISRGSDEEGGVSSDKVARRTNEKIFFLVKRNLYKKLMHDLEGSTFQQQIKLVDEFYGRLRSELGISHVKYGALEISNAFSQIYESFTSELGFSVPMELVFFGSVPNGKAQLGKSDWDYVYGKELDENYRRLILNSKLQKKIDQDLFRFSNSAEGKLSELFGYRVEPQAWVNHKPDAENRMLEYLTEYNPIVFRIGPDKFGFEVWLSESERKH